MSRGLRRGRRCLNNPFLKNTLELTGKYGSDSILFNHSAFGIGVLVSSNVLISEAYVSIQTPTIRLLEVLEIA